MSKRIIKKYPNRRLYDTEISRYITLEDIKQLVLSNTNFQVIDARSEEDLTNSTLLQIVLEQEDRGAPILTRELLQNIIRFYGHSMQTTISHYLEQSLAIFIEQQAQFKHNINELWQGSPLQLISKIAEENINVWRRMQENFFQSSANQSSNNNSKKEEQAQSPAEEPSIDEE